MNGHCKNRIAVGAIVVIGLLGCDSVLDIQDPDIIDPEDLNTLQGAQALYAGAIGDFAVAKDGGQGAGTFGGIVTASGMFTDEFRFGGTPPNVREMDLRQVTETNPAWDDIYTNLHRAREAAENAATTLREVVDDPSSDSRIGEMYAFSAYVHIMLGENYCSGVPFSTIEPEIAFGEPLATQQIFERALTRLDDADQFTGGNALIANLAAVARGRALLNLGRYSEAAAAVASVPSDFEYVNFHSEATERQVNGFFVYNYELDYVSISDGEGGNGLDFASAGDPRVPVLDVGLSRFDSETPMFRYLNISSRSSPMILANGVEARMIEAEAALQADDVSGWLDILNTARALVGLSDLTDPGTADARVDLMFRERAFWLFATGHRLGDVRRSIRQYGRDPETVLPTGDYHKDNLVRGTEVNIVIPLTEENNPNFTGCLDRNA